MSEIMMFTGKGGVGKTTMSVATALFFARTKKTLIVSTDPSGSLENIFHIKFEDKIEHIEKNLDIVELTRKTVLRLWREKFADEIYAVLSSFLPVEKNIIDYIEGAPGINEEFMLDYVLMALKSKQYDLIIWDTAPTASILNLLKVQYLFYTHLTQAQKVYITLKSVIKSENPLNLIKKWRKLTEEIINMLENNTSAWIVTNPEKLPVEQALSLGNALKNFGISINGYILNKLLADDICKSCKFLNSKRLFQQIWKNNLYQRSTLPIKTVPEMLGDATEKEKLLKISNFLYKN